MNEPAAGGAGDTARAETRNRIRNHSRWLCRGFLLCLALPSFGAQVIAASQASSESESPAVVIAAGSVARSQVVALGRDLVLDGESRKDAVVLNADASVRGVIAGDLVVIGGDAKLRDGARIEGDVFVLGGLIEAASSVEIGGRTVSYPSLGAAWLTLVEGPSLGLSPFSRVVLGAKLALLAAWLALAVLLLATFGGEVLRTSRGVRLEPLRSFLVGLTGVLALFLTTLLFSSFASEVIGMPLLVLTALVALILKLWGMVAVFHALGEWLAGSVLRRRLMPLNAAALGLFVLGVLKLFPYVGSWAWTAATFVGVGAALTSKLGRDEPWFLPLQLAGGGRSSSR